MVEASRRAILGALAVAPLIGASASRAANVPPSNLRAAIAAYYASVQACDNHHSQIYEPLHDAVMSQIAAIPPVVIRYRIPEDEVGEELRSDDEWSVWKLKRVEKGLPDTKNEPEERREACRKLRAGIDRRDAVIEKIKADANLSAVCEESDRLGTESYHALCAAIEVRVSTHAELIEKMAFIREHVGDIDEWHFDIVADDVRRLAGGR
jgi:hypothetical protein